MHTTLKNLSDIELVTRFRVENCETSIRELINRHKDRIYTNIFFIVKDTYVAEDLFQETLIKAAQNIKNNKYTDQGKFLPWVCRIAHNLCIDYIRKCKSQSTIRTISNEIVDINNLGVTTSYQSNMERQEVESIVWKLINCLPQEQLDVVLFRIYGELSFKEISEIMGVSINTSLGRMRYALINLRKYIEEEKLVLR